MTKDDLLKIYDKAGDFHEGMAWVQEGNVEFHVCADGAPAYDQRYDAVGDFHEGLAWACNVNGNWFHIRPDGKPAYEQTFDETTDFIGGVSEVRDGTERFKIRPDGSRVD